MSPQSTRALLIRTAMIRFGREGYEPASTRAIAADTRTNISSIADHLGGKGGLRIACVADQIQQIARRVPPDPSDLSPRMARATLRRQFRRMVTFLILGLGADEMVGFVLRELAQPDSPVLERLYATLVEPRHAGLCPIWSAATGRPADSDDVKLAVFTLVGQVACFPPAAPVVQRRMGWQRYSRPGARAIARRPLVNLELMTGGGHG